MNESCVQLISCFSAQLSCMMYIIMLNRLACRVIHQRFDQRVLLVITLRAEGTAVTETGVASYTSPSILSQVSEWLIGWRTRWGQERERQGRGWGQRPNVSIHLYTQRSCMRYHSGTLSNEDTWKLSFPNSSLARNV